MAESTLIAEAFIPGKPVPWSPPRSFRGGKPGGKRWHVHEKNPKLIDWQDRIREAFGQPENPHKGGVFLLTTFFKGTPDARLWGKRWIPKPRTAADLTNLHKAAEDAVATYQNWKGKGKERKLVREWRGVIENDCQVCDALIRKRYGERDGVQIKVYATED